MSDDKDEAIFPTEVIPRKRTIANWGGQPFKKGNSGGCGRPKSFNYLIRRETKGGKELVQLAVDIMRGLLRVKGYGGIDTNPTIKERFEALKWLADRGWGKALESYEVTTNDGSLLSDKTIDEVLILARLPS